jgi:hypothetical protein
MFVGGIATNRAAYKIAGGAKGILKMKAEQALLYLKTAVSGADLTLQLGKDGVAIGVLGEDKDASITAAKDAVGPFATIISLNDALKDASSGNWKTYYNYLKPAFGQSNVNVLTLGGKNGMSSMRAERDLEIIKKLNSMNEEATDAAISAVANSNLGKIEGKRGPCPKCGSYDCEYAPKY